MLGKLVFCATVSCAAVPAASGAATMQAVYSGTVSNSYDLTGLFGLGAGASLGGLPYTLTYTYDTGSGLRFTGAASDENYGGTGYDVASPMFSAILAIGDVAQLVFGASFAYARQYGGTEYDYLDHYAQDDVEDLLTGVVSQNYAYQWGYDYSNSLPANLDVPFSFDQLAANGAAGGEFGFFTYDFVEDRYSTYAYGSLYPDSLRVTVVAPAAIPLPAGAWLLVLALGALAALRRTRPRVRT